MNQSARHVDPAEMLPDIAAFREGDRQAGDRLCERLRPAVRLDAARMLGDDDADLDDVIQESLLACIGYLNDERGFSGDPTRLAVTIARNRCRDLLRRRQRRPHVSIDPLENWLADPSRSALDDLTASEQRQLLQAALDSLSRTCRSLLRALYIENRTPEEMRARIGLGTVHGVYYRRSVCLAKVKLFLQRRGRLGSGSDASPADRPDRGLEDSAS